MRLVRILHDRCNEWDGTEHVLAPDDWDMDKVYDLVDEAVKECIVAAKEEIKELPHVPYRPDYSQFPDKTVREINAEHAVKVEAAKKAKTERDELTKTFRQRLLNKGFKSLDADPDSVEVTAYWGHGHGLNFRYNNSEARKFDSL